MRPGLAPGFNLSQRGQFLVARPLSSAPSGPGTLQGILFPSECCISSPRRDMGADPGAESSGRFLSIPLGPLLRSCHAVSPPPLCTPGHFFRRSGFRRYKARGLGRRVSRFRSSAWARRRPARLGVRGAFLLDPPGRPIGSDAHRPRLREIPLAGGGRGGTRGGGGGLAIGPGADGEGVEARGGGRRGWGRNRGTPRRRGRGQGGGGGGGGGGGRGLSREGGAGGQRVGEGGRARMGGRSEGEGTEPRWKGRTGGLEVGGGERERRGV